MASTKRILIGVSFAFVVTLAYFWGHFDGSNGRETTFSVQAQVPEKLSPVEPRSREVYYPNSEALAEDEMRVIACGTGMPTTRAAQAAACFLVELSNGDKFIFDIGTGSAERISSLQIPYDYLDKIFVGHLHADHFGSLGEIFIGGALMGRYAQDADLAIHECFVAVPDLVAKMRSTPEQALLVGTQIHTAPEAFGKVMSKIQPRMAIAYHFFKDFDTTAQVNDRIRTTYSGPLSLAEDFMVWNVTKDDITVRE